MTYTIYYRLSHTFTDCRRLSQTQQRENKYSCYCTPSLRVTRRLLIASAHRDDRLTSNAISTEPESTVTWWRHDVHSCTCTMTARSIDFGSRRRRPYMDSSSSASPITCQQQQQQQHASLTKRRRIRTRRPAVVWRHISTSCFWQHGPTSTQNVSPQNLFLSVFVSVYGELWWESCTAITCSIYPNLRWYTAATSPETDSTLSP